jgi:hypothetical protein
MLPFSRDDAEDERRGGSKLSSYSHQVAGHPGLVAKESIIYKPMVVSEMNFYSFLYEDRPLPELLEFVPNYHGVCRIDSDDEISGSSPKVEIDLHGQSPVYSSYARRMSYHLHLPLTFPSCLPSNLSLSV